MTLTGTTTVTLSASLSGDMNVGRDDSNYLYDYSLNGGGVGPTGDMKSVTITYGPDSNVTENQWTPLPGLEGTSPQDASDDVTTTVWGQINRSDPIQTSIAKPTVEREIVSSDPTTKLIVACNWDSTQVGYQYDNIGVEQIVRQQNTTATNFVFQNTETWTLPDTTNPTITADPLATSTHTPVLTGTVNPSSSSKAITDVMVVVTGGQTPLTLRAIVNGTIWSAAVPTALPDGTYNVQVTATDNAGNTAFVTATLTVGNQSPTFIKLTGPTSGTYAPGQSMTITWTAGYVPANGNISLCLDPDAAWNGNEKWIEVGKKAAANGSDSYVFDPSGFAPGTYYVGGYLYNNTTHTPTYSHLPTPITILAPTFTLAGPTSGTYAPGQSMTITWTAGYVPANGNISLCLDPDAAWNGNEKWIEVGKKAAANGSDSYVFDPSGFAPGTYYVGGYLYNNTTHTPTYSHLPTPITILAPTFTLAGPTSGTYAPANP